MSRETYRVVSPEGDLSADDQGLVPPAGPASAPERRALGRRLAALSLLLLAAGALVRGGRQAADQEHPAPQREPEAVSFAQLLAQEQSAGSSARNWTREHIGFLKNIETGKCLDLQGLALVKRNSSVVMAPCEYYNETSNQRWAIDVKTGYIRNLFTNGHCLDVVGSPGWKQGTPLDASKCDYGEMESDQRWKFDEGGFIVNRLSGHCINASTEEWAPAAVLGKCEFDSKVSRQSWQFVGLDQVAAMQALSAGRPQAAVTAEHQRRAAVKSGDVALLVLDDFVQVSDPTVLLSGKFFQEAFTLFHEMTPSWDKWDSLSHIWTLLGEAGTVQMGFGTVYILNFLSNMAFAGMNFVQGFDREDLSYMEGFFKLSLASFLGPEPAFGCHSGDAYKGFCLYPRPVEGEKMGITTFQSFIEQRYGAALPDHTFFEDLSLGQRSVSWESDLGHNNTFALVDAGVKAARAQGVEPMNKVKELTGPRFAFDVEGILPILEEGFGWMKARDVKYASNGANGAAVLEKLMAKYGETSDVLGLLMTESVLSMHLTYDHTLLSFVVDLTHLQKYSPIEGYAPLGGKAYFVQNGARLVTVQLEYQGKTYNQSDFSDEQSLSDYVVRSKLSGWRFAEKAIIASLWAKTQLLVHVKTIHMELAPVLQAVTIDYLPVQHPLRRMLQAFIGRSSEATKTNLRVWFEYRAGEFSLAPLPMEEQLKLVTEHIGHIPLSLADLDMERYAKLRGMSEFSKAPSTSGFSWRWHYRASKVEGLLDELLECWLGEYYGGSDAQLDQDSALINWWTALQQHMPALRQAAQSNKDWLTSAQKTTTPPPTTPSTTPPAPVVTTASTSRQFVSIVQKGMPHQATVATPAPFTYAPTLAPTAAPAPAPITGSSLVGGVADSSVESLWRRLQAAPAPAGAAQQKTFGVDVLSLRRVLRTLMLWGSWIHEDVGHSTASLLYDPVHTPTFVPKDGVGIPLVPLSVVTSIYRDFIFVERAKLVDPLPSYFFDQKECNEVLFLKHCNKPKDDYKCYFDFQEKLNELKTDSAFSECDEHGFYSCVDRVESSASS